MKTKVLIFLALISIIFSGLTTIIFISVLSKDGASKFVDQEMVKVPETYTAASLSKGTILFLLAVGVIGALGVNRTKKSSKGPVQRNGTQDESNYETVNEERQKLMTKNS
ncbi:MAG: hypothetical protein P8X68_22810 [Desulfobacterales bacterium]|jgi:hypothetical protein